MNHHPYTAHLKRTMYLSIILAMILSISAAGQVRPAAAQEPAPRIEAFAWLDRILLIDWPAGSIVHLEITDPAFSGDAFIPEDSGGVEAFFPEVDLAPGTVITAQLGDVTKVLEISALSATPDADTGMVGGTASPGVWVHVYISADHFSALEFDVEADGEGYWSVDLSEYAPLVWMTRGEMWESDEDGDVTYAIWHVSNPLVEVWLAQNEIRAFDWPTGAELTFTVGEFEATETAQPLEWIESGWAVVTPDFPLEPGMTVTVSYGGVEATTEIQPIRITSLDPLSERVYGIAPAGASVELGHWEDSPVFRFFSADGEGKWMVDYTIPSVDGVSVDLNWGQELRLFLRDGHKNATVWRTEVRYPRFTVFPEWEWFDGMDWEPGMEVFISVEDKPQCSTSGVSGPDFFFNGPFPEGCDIQAGDLITFTDGNIVRTHTTEYLTVSGADAATNTVRGRAWAGKEVFTWPHATGEQLIVAAGEDELWGVDFTGVYDLTPYESGRAQIFDEQWNGTAVDWTVPKPFIIAFPENNAVEAWEWPASEEVTLTIDHATGLEWTGTAAVTDWGDPRTYIRFEFGDEYDLQSGDIVTLTGASEQRSHTVLNLSITGIDALADTITGTTDPDTLIQARVHGYDNFDVWSDGDGNWTADFAPMDLTMGMGGRIERVDAGGHLTAVDWGIGPTSFRDDFNGEELGPGWYWSSEDSEGSLQDGWLRVLAAPTGTGVKNLLLRPAANGDFMIKTHLIFEPTQNYTFAGLVIYGDQGNFLQFGRAFCDHEWCAGNAIYFDTIIGADITGPNFATPVDSPDEVYLRLERIGTMVRAFYSAEGSSWYQIGMHWMPEDFVVTGVGLTASQNFAEEEAVAQFDFFELNEGGDFLPEGFHDYDGGEVPSWACNAGGWAADPDDRGARLTVEIVVDHATVETLTADAYRPDLEEAGVCEGGNCSFETGLWDQISSYEEHSVAIWAQDTQSGEWVRLSNSPKQLTCRTYDIYAFDPATGGVTQVSNIRNADEYNPSWSPNGKKVVHDTWFPELGKSKLYITDANTGASTLLRGALGGNDAAWSPNGKWIVFDRVPMDKYNLYLLPATGGTSKLVRNDAVSADWAPSGKRLVFQQLSDGSIRTMAIDGGKGGLTTLDYGANPSWSPNGAWIAYERDGNIWKVGVNALGKKMGEPVLVVDMLLDAGQPTWSPDSQTIVFHAGLDRFYDLWSVPAAGGDPVWLNGAPDFGDYDPAYAKNSAKVAYSSYSPSGQATRHWGLPYTYDFTVGAWTEGIHQYHLEDSLGGVGPDVAFTVSPDAPSYEGFVLLRGHALVANTGEGCQWIDTIQTDQATRAHSGWVTDGTSTFSDAVAFFSTLEVGIVPDGGERVAMTPHIMMPYQEAIWWEFICRSTQP